MMESQELFNTYLVSIHEEIYCIMLWVFWNNYISLNIFERYPTYGATKIKGGLLVLHND